MNHEFKFTNLKQLPLSLLRAEEIILKVLMKKNEKREIVNCSRNPFSFYITRQFIMFYKKIIRQFLKNPKLLDPN